MASIVAEFCICAAGYLWSMLRPTLRQEASPHPGSSSECGSCEDEVRLLARPRHYTVDYGHGRMNLRPFVFTWVGEATLG